MPTAQPHLELTDTVTSIKFMDPAATTAVLIAAMPYRLSFGGWSPRVARRNKNPLGLPYSPVRETLTVDIFGTSAGDCYTKLQAINTLLDQGERWYNNEVVSPVFIRYQPLGSDKTTYMKDVVIGGAADDSTATLMELPNDFNFTGFTSRLKGVVISFWRRNGFWLGEDETLSLSTQAQRAINTVTWAIAAPNLSPFDFRIKANPTTIDGALASPSGILVTTHSELFIGIQNGESIGGSSTVDTTNNSVGGNVGRFTCSTTVQEFFKETITEELYKCEYVAVYATLRNNSTTLDVYLQLNVNFSQFPVLCPEIKIAFVATPLPQVVFLGLVPTRGRQPFHIGVFYRSLSGAPTFDVDQLMYVGVNRATNIIALNSFKLSTVDPLVILHRLLLEPQPEVAFKIPTLGTFEERVTYSGSAYQFTGGSNTLLKTAYVLFVTHGTKWQLTTAANAAVTLDPTLIRSKAYLLPE